jgi:hypothetical protein
MVRYATDFAVVLGAAWSIFAEKGRLLIKRRCARTPSIFTGGLIDGDAGNRASFLLTIIGRLIVGRIVGRIIKHILCRRCGGARIGLRRRGMRHGTDNLLQRLKLFVSRSILSHLTRSIFCEPGGARRSILNRGSGEDCPTISLKLLSCHELRIRGFILLKTEALGLLALDAVLNHLLEVDTLSRGWGTCLRIIINSCKDVGGRCLHGSCGGSRLCGGLKAVANLCPRGGAGKRRLGCGTQHGKLIL